STGQRSRTKALNLSTTSLVCSPWLIQVETATTLNSSSPSAHFLGWTQSTSCLARYYNTVCTYDCAGKQEAVLANIRHRLVALACPPNCCPRSLQHSMPEDATTPHLP
ncbi:unnamed protein product, partial [Ectocarpus sp. 13 AM-2016]